MNIFVLCFMIWVCQRTKVICQIEDGVWCPIWRPIYRLAQLSFSNFLALCFYNAFVFLSATWIKSIFWQLSQKLRFDPKRLINFRFFDITYRVSNIFSIFFWFENPKFRFKNPKFRFENPKFRVNFLNSKLP
jgi:hypothetical protein